MAAETTSQPAQPSHLDLDAMSLDQLNQLKQNEENRLELITSRYTQLRAASARFHAAKTALSSLTPSTENNSLMIPLTASLYAPGRIRDPNKIIVELGTGFYVEKSNKEAHAFLERKIKIVDSNSENIVKVIQVTRQNVESINGAMRGKMLEIRARSEGLKHQKEIQDAMKQGA
uniref:Prefoldin subunit 5 n=1 Tax=Ditylum brightwellii TaxID=49249 RepID=A0A6U3Q704_9STRA|mmetsp:Transcript_13469/g.18062  ORF Transcript_13469/g.18062 Transcript_13469/m.18062 type:complete len:174 (+) Transcript_13469:36-557(+)